MKKVIWISLVVGCMMILVACGGTAAEPAVSNPSASGVATAAPTDNQIVAEQPAAPANEENDTAASPSEPAAEVQPVSSDGFVDPNQVAVKGTWYIDAETNFLYVIGSVVNNSNTPISGVVEFVYYDDQGQALLASNFTGDSDAERTNSDEVSFSAPIPAGGTGYYNRPRDLAKVNGSISKVEIFLKYAIAETVAPTMDLADLKWEVVDEVMTITASLSNNGTAACVYPSVYIAFLKGGEIIAVEDGVIGEGNIESLDQGQTIEMTVNKYILPAGFDDIQVVGDCAPTSFPRD